MIEKKGAGATMTVERSRIALVGGAAAFALLRALRLESVASAATLPEVVVYKSPT